MRRRALLASVAVATTSLSGCLGTAYRPVGGDVRSDFGSSHLHLHDDPLVEGGLGDDNDAQFHTRLVVSPETAPTFLQSSDAESPGHLQNRVADADFDSQFFLLFEARMSHDAAYHVHTRLSPEPNWTGWSTLGIPLETDSATDVADEYYPDADELVCTALYRYESASSPGAAEVTLYDEDGRIRAGPLRTD
ncbi:hypothetical protein SAMN04487949_2595 [Halogranum gelatinilyticum]|uniref:Uncharacterized protein n=1 Tax=Halogranum gelatinilyticum TaxID=660521 RepID=A0A1G9W3F9_9EURY|nr:hypothetical protein [Halogranum gelatinilyticum]SDM78736.1 hypothetical protein SAMN04487949_2595 [Halogranum gelatinilyticum]